MKRIDKQVRDRPRNEVSRNPPRNNGSEKLQTKKFQIRQGENSFFGKEGIKKQQIRNEPGNAAQIRESQSATSRFFVDDEAFKGRNKPHSEPVLSNQGKDIGMIPVHHGGSQTLILQAESQTKCVDLVSPAHKASTEKVYKSRLAPPRPAKNIIQDNKAMVSRITATEKQSCLTREKRAVDVAVLNETPSSEMDVVQKCSFTIDPVSWSEGEVMPDTSTWGADQNKIDEFSASSTVNSVEQNELVVKMAGLSEGRSFETKPEPFQPPEEVFIGDTSGTPEKPEKLRIYEEEVDREADKIQEKSRDNLSKCFECKNQRTAGSVQMLKDWSGLEKSIHTALRGFFESRGFAAEMSRTFPGIQGSLNQQISNFEEMLKNITRTMSDEHDTHNQESTGKVMGIKFAVNLPEESKTPEHPGSMEQSASLVKDGLVSATGAASLQILLQTNDISLDSREACEDLQGPKANDDQEAKVIVSVCKFKGESSREEKPAASVVDIKEKRQSQNNPMVTSCSEEFVLVKPDFAESDTKAVESGSDWGLVESSRNQVLEVGAKKREIAERSQSCQKKSKEIVEMQLKRQQTSSTNSHVGRSSKFRRLIEITADEIKAMAVPELVLMSLQEGRNKHGHQMDVSTGSNTEGLQEQSGRDVDSCEEVDEVAAQQPATQQLQPATEVLVEDVQVFSAMSSVQQPRRNEGFSLDGRKDENKTVCKIS